MLKIQEASVHNAVPAVVAEQPWVKALAAAWSLNMKQADGYAGKAAILANLDDAPEELLDALAIEFRAPVWQDDYTPEFKRRIIRASIPYYKSLGTKAAMEKTIAEVYGDGVEVQEWFQYEGAPGTFRVNLNAEGVINALLLREIIQNTKRAAAKLIAMAITSDEEAPMRVGIAIVTSTTITIESATEDPTEIQVLADQAGNMLSDENGYLLIL